VAALHTYLTRYELVTWTSGNVSERVPGEDLFVVKGSHAQPVRPGLGRPRGGVPCVLTAMADEFGGPIPVGPFALIGDSIGREIVETLKNSRSPAVLMQNHGVFTIGPSARWRSRRP
jgi:L-ribulose-5-phosphate 4-epimerase